MKIYFIILYISYFEGEFFLDNYELDPSILFISLDKYPAGFYVDIN